MNIRQLQILFNLSQDLTSNCLLISVHLPDHIMQKLVKTGKTGKNTEINKQCDVKFWLKLNKI